MDVDDAVSEAPRRRGSRSASLRTLRSPTESRAFPSSLQTPVASRAVSKKRRLIADQRYFGLQARSLRAGLERLAARMSAQSSQEPRVDLAALMKDFGLERDAGLE